jgi:hypothetical protein
LRLQELFDELESLPGNAAVMMTSTQKINYLLSAIRPERALASVYSQIQTEQVRGTITFETACQDLRFRCEALRADDLFHATQQSTRVRALLATGEAKPSTPVGPSSTAPHSGAAVAHALITTSGKRQNKGRQDKTRQDKTRKDKTRQDTARHGKTRQDKTRQDKKTRQTFESIF